MTAIISGSSPSLTFSDGSTQNTAVSSPSAVGQVPIGNSSNGYTAATITAGTVGLRYASTDAISVYNSANNWSGNPDVNFATAGGLTSEL